MYQRRAITLLNSLLNSLSKFAAPLSLVFLISTPGLLAQDADRQAQLEENQARAQELLDTFKNSADAGQVYVNDGDFDNAILAYSQALKIAKQFEELSNQQGALNNQWTNLAIPSTLSARAKAFAGAKEYQAALKDYKEVLDSQEKNLPALIGRGQLFLELNALEPALVDFQTAIEEDRTNFEIVLGLGTAQVLSGQVTAGAINLRRAIQLSGIEADDFDAYLDSMNEEQRADLIARKFQKLFRLRGQAVASQQEFEEGLADIQRSLKIDPNDHETYFAQGTILLQAEQYVPSLQAIQKSIESYVPDDDGMPYSQGYLTKAAVHLEYAKNTEDEALKKRNYEAIVKDCDTLLALLEGPDTTTVALAEEATLEDSLELAGHAGGHEHAEGHDHAEGHNHAEGHDHAAVGNAKKFDSSSLAAPRAAAYYSRGVALRMMEQWGDAIHSFSQAIDNNPDLGEAYFRRGICFHYIDEDDLAIADFELTAVIDFEDPRARLWQGFSYAKVGKLYESVRAFSQAIEQSERFTPAYINRGLVYMQIGELGQAVEDFNEAIRMEPVEAEHYFKRGLAYAMLDNHEAAQRSFRSALRFNPNHVGAKRRLGQSG